MTGGMLGSSYSNTTVPYDSACPFTKAHGNYSTCTGDSLGATCNCCFSAVFEGMYNVMGSCIPQDSPITQTKSSMNKKYGFQTIFAAVFVLIQVFLLSLWFYIIILILIFSLNLKIKKDNILSKLYPIVVR